MHKKGALSNLTVLFRCTPSLSPFLPSLALASVVVMIEGHGACVFINLLMHKVEPRLWMWCNDLLQSGLKPELWV